MLPKSIAHRAATAGFALGLLVAGGPGSLFAAAPTLDDPLLTLPPTGVTIDFDRKAPTPETRAPSGNPLWAVPLSTLPITRERPVFSPGRRAPQPAVAPQVQAARPPPPPPPAEPEKLRLQLVGTIVRESEGIAVFVDPGTQSVVRLRTGEGHEGWILRAVDGRTVTLQKGQRSEDLSLPTPGAPGPAAAAPEL
jgi:general secretion pathway protein N